MFELSFLEAGRKMGHDGLARTSETLDGQCGQGFPTNFVGGAKRRRLITGLCHVMFIGVILFLLLLVSVVVQQ